MTAFIIIIGHEAKHLIYYISYWFTFWFYCLLKELRGVLAIGWMIQDEEICNDRHLVV